MEISKNITKLNSLQEKVERFESDNYGYELTPAKQTKLDKMYAQIDKLYYSMSEDELYEIGATDLIQERFYTN